MPEPQISIVMGSDSDLPIMQEAAAIIEQFSVAYEMKILSAHRTPQMTAAYAQKTLADGIQVIIAGAGGAAHLAGVIAASTILPVIGVPIQTKTLSGVDSLYSIVQMPPGVPVATMAINGAKNAGLLALQILALSNKKIAQQFTKYKQHMMDEVQQKNERLIKIGYQEYLNSSKK